jgi:hypothetical protein
MLWNARSVPGSSPSILRRTALREVRLPAMRGPLSVFESRAMYPSITTVPTVPPDQARKAYCTMTAGPLRRLQDLATELAEKGLRHQASDEGGESGGPAVRVQIDTDHRSSIRPYFQIVTAITQVSTNSAMIA